MPDGLRLALTTFTVLPLRPGRVDRRTAGQAMAWSPLVGALLAFLAAAVLFLGRKVFIDAVGPLLPSVLALALLALLTRGLHLDGLADTADGLASHAPPERALQVMRSPETGPLGAATVAFSLLIQSAALTSCVASHRGTESVLLAVLSGRLAMVWSCTRGVPAARPDGMGALVAGTVRRPLAALWTVAVAGEAFVYGRFDQDAGTLRGGVRALLALALALGVTWVLRRHVVRRFGGVTGDVLGALAEIAQTTVLVFMATELPASLVD